jgi:hypothetical protein
MERSTAKFAIHFALAAATVIHLGTGGCADEGEPQRPEGPGSPAIGADAAAAGLEPGAPGQAGADAGASAQGRADAAAADQLPCDVGGFLQARCMSCHGHPPLPGVPGSLAGYADLMKPSARPGQSVAQRALELIQSGAMPPGGGLSASELQPVVAWLQAGAQPGACTSDAGVDASAPPPSVCTSKRYWKNGDEGSPLMHPGKACIACHDGGREEKGPRLSIAGTVFPSLVEPDDCNGAAASGLQVVIKGADGRILTLTPNAAGNFYAEEERVALPYTAELRYQGRVRAMTQPQSSGDCNTCHTERGASAAPGRILLP